MCQAPPGQLRLQNLLLAGSSSAQCCPDRAFYVGLFFSLSAQGPPGKDGPNGPPGLPGPKVGMSEGTQNPEARELFDGWVPQLWITFGS